MSAYFFDESEDGYGRVFVPTGSWKLGYYDLIAREKVDVVRLSRAAGWNDRDVSFLRNLPCLRGVEIYSSNVHDISPIGALRELRLIGLECDLRQAIDLAAFPHLAAVKATWSKALESVVDCSELKHLNLVNWPEVNLRRLSTMTKLTRLQLTSRKLMSLQGLSALSTVTSLDLHNCPKLVSLEELRPCRALRHLKITSCKAIQDISPIADLPGLHELVLDDCGKLDTLTPLRGCHWLEKLSFLGTTNSIDGDLSFIENLRNLRILRFTPRPHYNRTRRQLLEQRGD